VYNFPALTKAVKHLRVRRFFACVLLLAVVGTVTSRAQPATPADLAQIRARADQADPEAQNSLGNVYANGLLGVKVDHAEALQWYQKAAAKGFAPAQFNLGLAHEMGRGVPADERQAFKFYLMSAEQGFGPAQFNVGNMYSTGRGVGQDLFEANLWYKQAADKGILEAQFNLGLGYEAGRGVKKDEAQAARWYKLAADRGFARAQYNMGLLLEDGRGVTKNEAAAANYYRAAADQGFAPAQNNLGVMISEGRGGLAKDPVEAFVWLSLAAQNGSSPAARDFVARTFSPEQAVAANRALAARLGGRSVAAAPAPTPASVPVERPAPVGPNSGAVVAERVAELTEALENARVANARYAEANQKLELEKAQMAQQMAQGSEAGKLIDQLRAQSQRLASQVEALTIEKDLAQREVSVLGVQLKDAQEAARAAASPAAAPAVDTARFQSEISTLTASLAQANDELNRLRQTNRELTDANATLQRDRTAVSAPARNAPTGAVDDRYPLQDSEKDAIIAGLQRDVVRLNDEVKRSTRELTSLNMQLRSLRNQAQTQPTAPAAGAVAASVTAATEARLAELTEKADQAAQEATRLQAENLRLSARLADVEAQAKSMRVDDTLAPRLEQAQRELKALGDRLATETDNFQKAQARVTELEGRIAATERQAAGQTGTAEELRRQLTTATQALGESSARVVSLTETNQRLESAVAEAQQARDRVTAQAREQVTALQSELAAAREGAAGLATLRTENEQLTARLAELSQQLSAAAKDNSAERLASAEAAAAKLQADFAALQKEKVELEAWAKSLEQSQAAQAAPSAELLKERDEFAAKLTEAERRFANASALVAAQKESVAKLGADNASLVARSDEDRKAAKEALAELTTIRQQLIAERERSDRWMKSSQSMTEKAAEQTTEARRAQAALAEVQTKLAATEEKIATNAVAIEALTTELETARAAAQRVASAEAELVKLRPASAELAALREERDLLVARILEFEKQPKAVVDPTLAPRLSEAQARIAALENELLGAQRQLAGTTTTAEELKAQLAAAQSTAADAATRTTATATALAAARSENEQLKQQLAALESAPKPVIDPTLAPRLAATQERVTALTTELAQAQARGEALAGEVRVLQEKVSAGTSTTEALTAQLATAQASLAESTRLQRETAASLAEAWAENDNLRKQVVDFEKAPKPVIDPTLAPRLAESQQRIAALEVELKETQQQAAARTAELTDLQRRTAEATQLASKTGTEAENAIAAAGAGPRRELEQTKAQLLELQKELYSAKQVADTATVLRAENIRLAERIGDLDTQVKARASAEALAPQLAAAQERLKSLERSLAEAQQQALGAGADVGKLRQQLAESEENLAASRQAVTALQTDLAAARQAVDDAGKLGAELTTVRAELATLQNAATEAAALREEKIQLLARAEAAEAKAAAPAGDPAIAEQLAQAQQQMRAVTDKAAADRRSYIQAQARIASLEADIRIQQRQSAGGGAEFEALKKQLAEANAALEKSNTDLVRLQAELVATRETAAEAATLRDQNRGLLARVTELENQPKPVVDETLPRQLAAAQEKIIALENDVRVARQQAATASAAVDDLQKQVAEAQQASLAMAALREANARLTSEVKEFAQRPAVDLTLAPRLAQAEGQARAATERVAALEKELREVRQAASGGSTQVENLQRELAAEQSALAKSQATIAELTELNAQLEKQALAVKAEGQTELAEVRDQVTLLQRELTSAKQAATAATALTAEVTTLRAAAAELATVRAENARLAERVKTLQEQPKPVVDETLAPRLAQAQTRIAALEAQLRAAQESGASAVELRQQLEESNQALEKSSTSVAELTALNDRLVQDVAAAREAARAEVTAARNQVAELQGQLSAARQTSTDSATLRAELSKLRTEAAGLATLRSENERLRAAAAEALTLRSRLEQLTRDNEQVTSFMNANRADLEKSQARVTELEKQIAEVRTSGGRSTEELAKLQGELTEANRSVEKLNTTVAELTGANDRLEQDLESAKKSLNAALAAQAQAMSATQPDAYKMEIATLTARVKELENQLEEDRGGAAKEFASLAAQLQRARETNRSLSEANRSLMSARQSEIPTVNKDEFDQLQSRVNDLIAVGDELRRQNQKLAEDNQRFTSEQAVLREQLEDARKVATVLPGLADEKAALQERLEAVGAQLASAQREIDTLQRTGGDTAAQLVSSQQAAQRAQAELATLRARVTDAEKAADSHNLSVAELTELNTRLETEREDLRKQLAAARAEASRIAQSASTVEQLKAEADRSAQQNIDTLSAQLAQVRRELQTARDINTRIVEANTTQERERAAALTQLRQENAALVARLTQAQGTLDQIASAARLATPASVLASGGTPAPGNNPPPAAPVRYHTVVEGDSLSRISLRYYGTGNRWQEIFQANRDLLQGSSTLRVGMQLRIP
jgi:TPR repeat protein/chromosome segregation ATPase